MISGKNHAKVKGLIRTFTGNLQTAVHLNFEYYISRRLSWEDKGSFSRFIIRIAIIAIALSVSVMVISVSLIDGFTHEIREKVFGFWGEIHVHNQDNNLSFETTPISDNPSYVKAMRALTEVKMVSPYITKAGILKTKSDIDGIVLKGVDASYDWQFVQDYLVDGQLFRFPDSGYAKQVLLSKEKARKLKLKAGDNVVVYFIRPDSPVPLGRKLQVAGIYNTGLQEYDEKFGIVDLRMLRQVNQWEPNQIGGWEVRLNDVDAMQRVNDTIYYQIIDNSLYAETIRDVYPNIFEWLNLQRVNEAIILIIMVVVAVLNMVTALIILILDRTRMIGILKALGAGNASIRRIFLYKSVYIVANGLLWGNLLGITFCLLQKYTGFIRLDEANYYLSVAPIHFNILYILLINLGTLLICSLVLLLPSAMISRVSPMKAIRFE